MGGKLLEREGGDCGVGTCIGIQKLPSRSQNISDSRHQDDEFSPTGAGEGKRYLDLLARF